MTRTPTSYRREATSVLGHSSTRAHASASRQPGPPAPTAWRGGITSTWRGCRPARGLKGSLDLQCTHSTDLSHSNLHPIRRSISIFSVVITPANQFQVRPPRADHSPRTVTREASSMPSLMSLTPWRRKKRAAGVPARRRGTSLGALWRRLVRTLTCTRRPHY